MVAALGTCWYSYILHRSIQDTSHTCLEIHRRIMRSVWISLRVGHNPMGPKHPEAFEVLEGSSSTLAAMAEVALETKSVLTWEHGHDLFGLSLFRGMVVHDLTARNTRRHSTKARQWTTMTSSQWQAEHHQGPFQISYKQLRQEDILLQRAHPDSLVLNLIKPRFW